MGVFSYIVKKLGRNCISTLITLVDISRKVALFVFNKGSVTLSETDFSHCQCSGRCWAKVIFSQACVKNCVHGGVSASVHAGIHPPGTDTPQEQTSPEEQMPPTGSRHPPGRQTAAYGQRAAGTHPTGMHSC